MADAGHNHKAAVRNYRRHGPEVGRLNPAVPFTPQHQMWMLDFRHAEFELPAFPFPREVDRRSDPDSFRHTKRLFQNSLKQRLDLSKPFAEAWNHIRREALRHEQRGRRGRHHRPRQLLASHHRAEKADLLGIEEQAEWRDWIECKHSSEPLWLHQQHPRGDDTAGRMGGKMAILNI